MNYGSLRQDVRRLSDQGRFGDSMMMHVNPIEVAALDSMVPGGLTRNPATGQPEAWLPLLGLALGATIGGATAKKRKQGILEGILMGGGMGLLGGMGAGALAGGTSTALASTPAALKSAAAANAATQTVAPTVAASQTVAPTVAGNVAVQGPVTAKSASLGAKTIADASAINPMVITPTGVPVPGPPPESATYAMNLANTPLENVGSIQPLSPDGTGIASQLPGRIAESQANPMSYYGKAFMEGAGESIGGYGGNIKEGLGWMADNPMMTMGGAWMLDQAMNDEDEEEYGEYDGPLAYGSWRHGGAG